MNIAYQVAGDGPIDLVYVPGWVSNVETAWEDPDVSRFLERLASFSRVILFDKRGTGLSDRVPIDRLPTLEQRMDDVRAVMDAAGSERAALFGASEGGVMCALFAATYPERSAALVIYGSFATAVATDEYPHGMAPREAWDEFIGALSELWDDAGGLLSIWAPSVGDDPVAQAAFGRYLRSGASPSAVVALTRMNSVTDVRHVLPAICVPTLVIHRSGDMIVTVEAGRDLAEMVEGSKYLELPGEDHLWFHGDTGAILDEMEEFLTGTRSSRVADRVLATVLFTDIVESTRHAAALGDRRWRDLLARHDRLTRRELERHRGRAVKTMGDGFLATFDGPARAIRCACSVRNAMRDLGIELRAGLHTGECELIGDDVGGIAVNIGARVGSVAEPGEVLVSRTVTDLVAGSGIEFSDRGLHSLKGVPGEWQLFAVTDC
ncbi:MAG TPA: adenylate/guanylate cyclase domain-containing protein [Thermoleophilaceae bacterium]|nr:adenylate/guanylate cyclase domain-containing protein [Thermoleophilaceae bacterium]